MISKLIKKVGKAVLVFLVILVVMIVRMIIEFNYIEFLYTVVVISYLIKYLKLKLT
ncbi:MAG TPA: hypothetical protein PLV83_01695 [Bacilli bacterium]|nr:hypothetical protein [Bacilli bacterium]